MTWLLNRHYTFAGRGLEKRAAEAVYYAAIQVGGSLINFAIFAVTLVAIPSLRTKPVVALAFGAVGGLAFNFSMTNLLLYRTKRGSSK